MSRAGAGAICHRLAPLRRHLWTTYKQDSPPAFLWKEKQVPYFSLKRKVCKRNFRLSEMIYRFFDNCINECYIVGEGSPLPSPCLYRYTRRDLSSFSLPLRGRGTATRWKEFIAMRSFRHFLAKMTPRPLLSDACKGASHTCKSTPYQRNIQRCIQR